MTAAAVHGADITGQDVGVHFIWLRISAQTEYMRSILFERPHNDTLRELEAQHPLVSGWKPHCCALFVQVERLTVAEVDRHPKLMDFWTDIN